ncbi:MAG TPA: hypothetical protein VNO30_43560 [Kofleriaceae bacterium]|nr:hypothetical protein [Kofleriaceae bacterium]
MTRTRWQYAAQVALPAYWLLLLVATHYPRVQIPGEVTHSDKLVHFAAFGVLAFLYWQFARATQGGPAPRVVERGRAARLRRVRARADAYLKQHG